MTERTVVWTAAKKALQKTVMLAKPKEGEEALTFWMRAQFTGGICSQMARSRTMLKAQLSMSSIMSRGRF